MARGKKVDDRLEKVEVDEAKEEEAADAIDGDCPWRPETPYPLDLVLDEDAMMIETVNRQTHTLLNPNP